MRLCFCTTGSCGCGITNDRFSRFAFGVRVVCFGSNGGGRDEFSISAAGTVCHVFGVPFPPPFLEGCQVLPVLDQLMPHLARGH